MLGSWRATDGPQSLSSRTTSRRTTTWSTAASGTSRSTAKARRLTRLSKAGCAQPGLSLTAHAESAPKQSVLPFAARTSPAATSASVR